MAGMENPDAGAGAFECFAGGECAKDTAGAQCQQPHALVIERGTIRTATVAELRRLARLGVIGGAA